MMGNDDQTWNRIMRINELYLRPSCSQILCTCMRTYVCVCITMSVHQHQRVCVRVCIHSNCMSQCVSLFHFWVGEFSHFSRAFFVAIVFFICFYCFFLQAYLLVVSFCYLFVYFPNLRFFMFLRTKFASTLSKPQVNTQCDRGIFFAELSIMILEKNISIDAGTSLIHRNSKKVLFGYVIIFYVLV